MTFNFLIKDLHRGLECVACKKTKPKQTMVLNEPFRRKDLIRNVLTVQKCQLSLCVCPFAFPKLPCKELRTPCSVSQLNSFPNKVLVCAHSNHDSPASKSSESSKFSITLGFNGLSHWSFFVPQGSNSAFA